MDRQFGSRQPAGIVQSKLDVRLQTTNQLSFSNNYVTNSLASEQTKIKIHFTA
jgi:hypothetical protein